MAKRFLAIVFVACFLAITPYQVRAHGGGLDRYGCHRETATGGYHCHQDRKQREDTKKALIILGGLAGVLVIFFALRRPTPDPLMEKGVRFVPAQGDSVGAFWEVRF